MAKALNLDRVVWEGWTPRDFIERLSTEIDMIMSGQSWKKPFKNKTELAEYCKDNQPYYKKNVPEVVTYFARIYDIK